MLNTHFISYSQKKKRAGHAEVAYIQQNLVCLFTCRRWHTTVERLILLYVCVCVCVCVCVLTSVFRQMHFIHHTPSYVHGQRISAVGAQISNYYGDTNLNANPNHDPGPSPNVTLLTLTLTIQTLLTLLPTLGWLGSRVVSVLDSGAEGLGFKSQTRRCWVTVLGKLFTPIVPLFTKQRNW